MSAGQSPSDELQELLTGIPADLRELALGLRVRIHALVADADEEVTAEWRQVAFTCGEGMKRPFCALQLTEGHVDLIFPRGADLSDPRGLLEGAGKKVRHVRLTRGEAADAPEIHALIEAAAERVRSEG